MFKRSSSLQIPKLDTLSTECDCDTRIYLCSLRNARKIWNNLLKLIRPCRDRKISRQNKTPSILRFHI